jgi:hypothetical protein
MKKDHPKDELSSTLKFGALAFMFNHLASINIEEAGCMNETFERTQW